MTDERQTGQQPAPEAGTIQRELEDEREPALVDWIVAKDEQMWDLNARTRRGEARY